MRKAVTQWKDWSPSSWAECPFCAKIGSNEIVHENELAFSTMSLFPVSLYHGLVIPKMHAQDYFCLDHKQMIAIDYLTRRWCGVMERLDPRIDGWNMGWNVGKSAGQTIMHAHFHVIPRRTGDCDNPQGGIRGCIPSKQHY